MSITKLQQATHNPDHPPPENGVMANIPESVVQSAAGDHNQVVEATNTGWEPVVQPAATNTLDIV